LGEAKLARGSAKPWYRFSSGEESHPCPSYTCPKEKNFTVYTDEKEKEIFLIYKEI
jgi:hypothetical protein